MPALPDRGAARELWQALIRDDVIVARNDFAWAVCTPRDEALLDAKTGIAVTESLATRDKASWMLLDTSRGMSGGFGRLRLCGDDSAPCDRAARIEAVTEQEDSDADARAARAVRAAGARGG